MVKNQLKAGSIISYLQMGLSVVIGLVYTPIMIRLLGQSEYGLYNTVASTISMLAILNFGFNSGYVRYYSKYRKDGNEEAISRLNGLFLIIFTIIGAIAALCGLYLTTHLELVFKTGLTTTEYKTARILMLLLTINLAISFPMSVFSNIISANERFIFLKLCGIMQTVISPLVTLPILLLGFRSIAMVVVTLTITLVVDCCYIYYVLVILKNKFAFNNFERGLFKSLLVYSGFIAINMIIDQINWSIDKLLLARYKGTISVAVYSVGYTLYHHYAMFSTAISGVFTPRIHNLVNQTKDNVLEQKKILTDLFVKVGRIQYSVLALICTGMIYFGRQFVFLWAGDKYTESYYVAILLMITASSALTQNVGLEIQRALNKHQFRSIVYAFMAIINLALSVYLCQLYGPIGSAVGTALSLVLANGLAMNIFYHMKCNIDIIQYWKNILQMSKGLIIPIVIGIIQNKAFLIDSWLKFAVMVLIYSVAYFASMWWLGFNNYEKSLIIVPARKVVNRYINRRSRKDD